MIEFSLQHEVVIVDILQLPQQILLANNEFDHFLGNGLADFLDG
jgi:phage-related baseplate assembly protein